MHRQVGGLLVLEAVPAYACGSYRFIWLEYDIGSAFI